MADHGGLPGGSGVLGIAEGHVGLSIRGRQCGKEEPKRKQHLQRLEGQDEAQVATWPEDRVSEGRGEVSPEGGQGQGHGHSGAAGGHLGFLVAGRAVGGLEEGCSDPIRDPR